MGDAAYTYIQLYNTQNCEHRITYTIPHPQLLKHTRTNVRRMEERAHTVKQRRQHIERRKFITLLAVTRTQQIYHDVGEELHVGSCVVSPALAKKFPGQSIRPLYSFAHALTVQRQKNAINLIAKYNWASR